MWNVIKKLKRREEPVIHDLFLIAILLKGIFGLIEVIGGILLFLVKSEYVLDLVKALFQNEIVEDPTDFIANYLINASHNLTPAILYFIALYLFMNGIIKVGLVLGLWFKKSWVYPLAGIILSLFVIYQSFRIFRTHSPFLLFFILIDVVIIALLRFEYRRLTRHKRSRNPHCAHN